MLETMHYGTNSIKINTTNTDKLVGGVGGMYQRKTSYSTSSDPTASLNNYHTNHHTNQYSNGMANGYSSKTVSNGGGVSGYYENKSTVTGVTSGAVAATTTTTTNTTTTSSSSKSQFERLVDNLRNNPEYKKEMALNRLIGFYRIGSEIGTGNFSQVRLGLHLLTREKVAVKILNKLKLDDKTQRLLLREISSMQRLHHPNIIRLYEVIHTQERLFICMEYASEGELYTKISNEGRINELHGRIIFSQILSAVEHMHARRIIHRDIKAENIFFACLDPYVVKVGDLGFSTEASTDKYLNTYCGSPPYAAPELFRDDSYLGVYVDIWALGVLLYFIVTGLMPFKADTVSKLKRVILNGEYMIPSFVSDPCQLLIKGTLRPVPTERFTIREIKDSAWLDHENRIESLEAFQFNPTLDKSELKPEEIYTVKFLDKLGISKNCLIASNLPATPPPMQPNNDSSSVNNPQQQQQQQQHAPLAHYHSHLYLNPNPNASINTMMDNLISNKSTLNYLNSQAYNYQRVGGASMPALTLTNDIKQSVNGTFRIIYHSVQKKLRNEWTSDENSGESFVSREFRALFGSNSDGGIDSGGAHHWNGVSNGGNVTLNSLQNHTNQTSSSSHNNTTTTTNYDDRWTSFELDDENSHAFDSRHPLSKAMATTTRNFHRININGGQSASNSPAAAATNGTTTTTNGQSNGYHNREMVNLDSIDNDDEKSEISSNKNSNDSGSHKYHHQQQQPMKSIFVRLNSNKNEPSVQSAPNGMTNDSNYNNSKYSNNNTGNENSSSSSSGGASRQQQSLQQEQTNRNGSVSHYTHHPPLKSSKSVPKHIYSSASQNGGVSSSNGVVGNGLTSKSHSNPANNGSKQQYSKLCSIL